MPLTEVIKAANQYLCAKQYSANSIYQNNRMWRHLEEYSSTKGITHFTPELCTNFLHEKGHIKCLSDMNKYERFKYRSMRVLIDIAQEQNPLPKYIPVPARVPEPFIDICNGYQAHMVQQNQKDRTVKTKLSRIRVFFRYLDGRNIYSVRHLEYQNVMGFVLFLQEKYLPVAKSNILFTLRDFLRYAERHQMTSTGVSRYVDKIYVNNDSRLPSYYKPDETERILQSVNRNSAIGKRDYAILLIAIQLGMRGIDICHLHISDIHWNRSEILFCQQKTDIYQVLPMTEDIRFAIADYLKNSRPCTSCDKLFVRMLAPYEAFTSSCSLYRILNIYIKTAGIHIEGKRHGMHSMRHSLSSRLLAQGTSLPVITGILGHSSTKATCRYLWMDTEQLRKVSLEVPYGI